MSNRKETFILSKRMPGATIRSFAAVMFITLAVGCHQPAGRFDITNYVDVGETEQLHEIFDEAFYMTSADGNMDIVVRRGSQNDIDDPNRVTQIVHVRSVFAPVEARNKIESSMINGVVAYSIIGDLGAVCFQGAGFASFSENRKGDTLKGELEQSSLKQVRRVGEIGDIFNRTRLSGDFKATRNDKAVVRILNEMNRFLGPQPRYVPPPPGTNPL
ncbi:MAG: hypothetical protein DHS20C16_33310 [Phycisphaerae bacterium]|nr:MAG: hypothetical protein DHS20C16_33310 [Phycisphaerae bacterium]